MSQLIYAIRGWTFSFLSSSPTRLARRLPYATVFYAKPSLTDRREAPAPTDAFANILRLRLKVYATPKHPKVYMLATASSLTCCCLREAWCVGTNETADETFWAELKISHRSFRASSFSSNETIFPPSRRYLLACLNSWRIFIVYSVFSSSALCFFFSYFCSHNVFYFAFIHLLLFAAWHI